MNSAEQLDNILLIDYVPTPEMIERVSKIIQKNLTSNVFWTQELEMINSIDDIWKLPIIDNSWLEYIWNELDELC